MVVSGISFTACLQLLFPQFFVGTLAHSLPFGLRLVEISFKFVLPFRDATYNRGVDTVDIAALIEHHPGDRLSRNESFEFLYGQLRREQIFNLFANVVIEFPDAVVLIHIEVNG